MDSTSHQNWLGFSLSNHHRFNNNINIPSSSDSSHLSLFQAFNTAPTASAQEVNAAVAAGRATDISLFTTSGPKLEDFLGSCTTTSPSQTPQQPLCGQFSTETPVTPTATTLSDSTSSEIYDSELKTIAASFLRGFASADNKKIDSNQKHQQLLVQAEPCTKENCIDGLEDMKPICGIIVAEGKAKVEKEDKVMISFSLFYS
uniref:Uncharacterized protein n=1 Tax=Salix viminalis TaxID=40686 RepID=A0A6N2MWN4_SALVM